MSKEDVIEMEGIVEEALPNAHVYGGAAKRPPDSGPHFRQAADELHPNPAGR